eukprot:1135262-Pleurochrysis_carterae.AAC.3
MQSAKRNTPSVGRAIESATIEIFGMHSDMGAVASKGSPSVGTDKGRTLAKGSTGWVDLAVHAADEESVDGSGGDQLELPADLVAAP